MDRCPCIYGNKNTNIIYIFFPSVINSAQCLHHRMSYQETVSDIEKSLGSFPGFFKGVPQDVLTQMWPIFKKYSLGESKIPPKYREMIGLAVAATIKCPYCETFHRGAAQMNGATDEELTEAAAIAGQTTFWSNVLHAQHYDINTFTKEFQAMGEYLSKKR
jgi:AhpD family alkylhydroperoxidase